MDYQNINPLPLKRGVPLRRTWTELSDYVPVTIVEVTKDISSILQKKKIYILQKKKKEYST